MDKQDSRPVLVLGGTGHYGSRIVAELLRIGARVRVVSRRADAARRQLGDAVEVVEGDVLAPETTQAALTGARSVVIALSAMQRSMVRQLVLIERDAVLRVLEEASRQGVRRVVYLSGYQVVPEFLEAMKLKGPFYLKVEVEEALRASDLEWTILGEAFSMEIFFAMIRGDTMTVPGGGPPAIPTVAPGDVGIIGAQTALRDDLSRQHIRVTGPEAISFPEAATRIGAVVGRPIHYRALPLFPIRAGLGLAGLFDPYFEYLRASLVLLNHFPQDVVAQVPEAFAYLRETFDYTPTTLEHETTRRVEAKLFS